MLAVLTLPMYVISVWPAREAISAPDAYKMLASASARN